MNKDYKNCSPIAVYGLNNWGGIEILDVIYGTDDYVVSAYNFGEGRTCVRKNKIYSSANGEYFKKGKYKVPLAECMKV